DASSTQPGMGGMNVVVGFETLCGEQQSTLLEMWSDQLEGDWQVFGCETTGNRESRESCKIGRDRKNVVEIHGQRVCALLTETKCGRRRRGCEHQIDTFK